VTEYVFIQLRMILADLNMFRKYFYSGVHHYFHLIKVFKHEWRYSSMMDALTVLSTHRLQYHNTLYLGYLNLFFGEIASY